MCCSEFPKLWLKLVLTLALGIFDLYLYDDQRFPFLLYNFVLGILILIILYNFHQRISSPLQDMRGLSV
jgi:hypothetical protein